MLGLWKGGDVWLLNPPKTSLGFLLAQQGFDVWIANTRTTRFGYGHATYTRKDKVSSASSLLILLSSQSFLPYEDLMQKAQFLWPWKCQFFLQTIFFPVESFGCKTPIYGTPGHGYFDFLFLLNNHWKARRIYDKVNAKGFVSIKVGYNREWSKGKRFP